MRALKILMLANDTTYTYNLRNELIERFVAEGHEVVVAAWPLLLQEELMALGCRLVAVQTHRHGRNPLADLSLLMKYRRLLLDERPDVVLSYNIKPNAYGGMACRMTKTRYMPNITGLGTAVADSGLMSRMVRALYRAGVAGAACVFFQNEENRQFFIHHHMLPRKARTRMLPGSGVGLRRHRLMPYPPAGGKVHFLFVARILREKGVDLYLRAAKRLAAQRGDVLFHICGPCDDAKYLALLKEAEQGGYVLYHGEQKHMAAFFETAHCVVHPSYYPEGMSNVLLEAAAHGRPVITTERAGCRETVDEGKSGFIIPIKDEGALVEAMARFLAMPWEQKRDMGLAGRAKVEREFDRQIVVKAYLEEIGRLGECGGAMRSG